MAKFNAMMSKTQKAEMDKRKKEMEKKGMSSLDCCSEDKYYYPESLRLNDTQLPEIDKWEVGKDYKLTILVKMTEYSANAKTNKNSARFEIMGVKADDGKLDSEQKKIVDFMVGESGNEDDED